MGPCSRSGCVGLPDWVLVLLAWPSGVCGGLGAGIKVLPFCTPVRKIGRRPKSGPCPVGDPHGASACSLGGPHLGASACCRSFPSSPGVCCGGTGVVLHKKYGEILFQKVALGYLLHFVQNGASTSILNTCVFTQRCQKSENCKKCPIYFPSDQIPGLGRRVT